jgi:hypothetical protein
MLAPSRRRDLYNFWRFFYIKLYILARRSSGLAKVEASPTPPARTVTHRRRPRHGGDHAMSVTDGAGDGLGGLFDQSGRGRGRSPRQAPGWRGPRHTGRTPRPGPAAAPDTSSERRRHRSAAASRVCRWSPASIRPSGSDRASARRSSGAVRWGWALWRERPPSGPRSRTPIRQGRAAPPRKPVRRPAAELPSHGPGRPRVRREARRNRPHGLKRARTVARRGPGLTAPVRRCARCRGRRGRAARGSPRSSPPAWRRALRGCCTLRRPVVTPAPSAAERSMLRRAVNFPGC